MEKFEVNSLIRDCIEDENIIGLRIAMGAIAITEKPLKRDEDFSKSLKYIKDKGVDICEEYDEKGLIKDTKENGDLLDEDDFCYAITLMKENFCKERIEDVRYIGEKLYGEKGSIQEKGTRAKPQEVTDTPKQMPHLMEDMDKQIMDAGKKDNTKRATNVEKNKMDPEMKKILKGVAVILGVSIVIALGTMIIKGMK